MSVVRDAVTVAFGQHSGVADRTSPSSFTPVRVQQSVWRRSSVSIGRECVAVAGPGYRPEPIVEAKSAGFRFHRRLEVDGLARLTCYHSQQGKARIERLGSHRIEVRLKKPSNQDDRG